MFLHSLGELALGSRLKAISDQLYAVADEVYRAHGTRIEARWFPLLRLLRERGPMAVGDIAVALGFTHPAISQLATRLIGAGWVKRRTDRSDARRSLLALTVQAERELETLAPVWESIRRGAADAVSRSGHDLLGALAAFEAELGREPLAARILRDTARERIAQLRIETFRPEWRDAFYRLNADWLSKYFSLEPIDVDLLRSPEKTILQPGGQIWFAVLGDQVVGTCALLREANGVYEIGKMAVSETQRGLGIGRKLLQAAIDEFTARRGERLFLETNSKLVPAIGLYESMGFVRQAKLKPDSHYQRSNVYMIYTPKKKRGANKRSRAE